MRIRLLMKDREYQQVLADVISRAFSDITIEFDAYPREQHLDPRTLILTDLNPDKVDNEALSKLRERTVFVSDLNAEYRNDVKQVFKYSRVSDMLSELSAFYYDWTGEVFSGTCDAKIITICSDIDEAATVEFSQALAREIEYKNLGPVILLPGTYINHFNRSPGDQALMAKILYYMNRDKGFPPGTIDETDEYGISTLRLSLGLNPLTELLPDNLIKVLNSIRQQDYKYMIFCIGTNYSHANQEAIRISDHVISLGRAPGEALRQLSLEPGRSSEILLDADNKEMALIADDFLDSMERSLITYEPQTNSSQIL